MGKNKPRGGRGGGGRGGGGRGGQQQGQQQGQEKGQQQRQQQQQLSQQQDKHRGQASARKDSYYARQPCIFEDEVVFVCEGDLWTANLSEKRGAQNRVIANRLTTTAHVRAPSFSPDGTAVAYTSSHTGAQEVYIQELYSASGAKQITNWGQTYGTAVVGWESSSRLLVSRAEASGPVRTSVVYEVSLDSSCSGPGRRKDFPGNTDACDANSLGRFSCEAHVGSWKRYNGGRLGQAWIRTQTPTATTSTATESDENAKSSSKDTEDAFAGLRRVLPEEHIASPFTSGGRLFFVLDSQDIRGELCSVSLDDPTRTTLIQHTKHDQTSFYVRNPAVCPRTGRIVYQHGGLLYIIDASCTGPSDAQPLDILLRGTPSAMEAIVTDGTRDLEDVQLDRSGRFICATVRGHVMDAALWEGPCTVYGRPNARLLFPAYLFDGRIGAFQFGSEPDRFLSYIVFEPQACFGGLPMVNPEASDTAKDRFVSSFLVKKTGIPVSAEASPVDSMVAVVTERNELALINYEKRSVEVITTGEFEDAIADVTWSPCGSFILFSFQYSARASIICAFDVYEGLLHELTPREGYQDYCPQVDPDCQYCYFLSSNRRLACVEDSLWNTAFDCYSTDSVMVVALRYDAPDPTVLFPCGPSTSHDDDQDQGADEDHDEQDGNYDDADADADRDPDGKQEEATMIIEDTSFRIYEIPVQASSPHGDDAAIHDLRVVEGGRLLYIESGPGSGGPGASASNLNGDLVCYNLRKKRRTVLRTGDVDGIHLPSDGAAILLSCSTQNNELEFHCFSAVDFSEETDAFAKGGADGSGHGTDGDDDSPRGARPCQGHVDLENRAVLEIEPAKEWHAMLAEIFARREQAYALTAPSPTVSVFDEYANLLPAVRSRVDFADLAREMIAEFSMSHVETSGGDFSVLGRHNVTNTLGFLGIEGAVVSNGFQVTHVYQGLRWASELRGPVSMVVQSGDVITSINGHPLSGPRGVSIDKALTGQADREVFLEVLRHLPQAQIDEEWEQEQDSQHLKNGKGNKNQNAKGKNHKGGKGKNQNQNQNQNRQHQHQNKQHGQAKTNTNREKNQRRQDSQKYPRNGKMSFQVRVKCIGYDALQWLQWQDGVSDARRHVHEVTQNQVGYIHIPDMESDGYLQFARDFHLEGNRKVLILDVRDNLGGYASESIIEKLGKQCIGMHQPKFGAPTTVPMDLGSTLRAYILIVNQDTASDAEILAHAFRKLGLGKIVGTRTWGGVTGYSRTSRLVDGAELILPTLRFCGGQGEIENCGVEPDRSCAQLSIDVDVQLKVAIEMAQELISKASSDPTFEQLYLAGARGGDGVATAAVVCGSAGAGAASS
ncbi:Tricorn protease-like [Hondaea fermentalgiana]|uniref:Tricorn protease-like n=1 Tax=Hondaea fermentalgiana TaxID=2315210 RepID=A0A2R5GF01_9STRA|nr:Tricorn protease-like [Hondaea fermentalgiana]|eukprot:GBG27183.1 Tricorn protease-like [Hondaea fermentalgiana]